MNGYRENNYYKAVKYNKNFTNKIGKSRKLENLGINLAPQLIDKS